MYTIVAGSAIALACLVGFAPAAWGVAMYSTFAVSSFDIDRADAIVLKSDTGTKFEIGTGSAAFAGIHSADGVPATWIFNAI